LGIPIAQVRIDSYDKQAYIMANLIVEEMNRHRRELSKIIASHLTSESRQILDSLRTNKIKENI
jgi:hypothetical protein